MSRPRLQRITKAEMIAIIEEVVTSDQMFGNTIVDMADVWREAISTRLSKMKKEDLMGYFEDAIASPYYVAIKPHEDDNEVGA